MMKFTNEELTRIIYNLGFAEVGSNHLWKLLSQRVLDIQPKNFNENQFLMIYNAFKSFKYQDKLLWAFLERTLIEVYPHLVEESEK